jgi:hypothetical protein
LTQASKDNITQQPYDQFSKQFFNELFGALKGEIKINFNYEIHADRRYVDFYWLASPTASQMDFQALGLLGRMVSQSCLLEPFHSPLSEDDISNCLLKLLMVQSVPGEKADKAETEKADEQPKKAKKPLPYLWIFATSVSDAVLDYFGAKPQSVEWCKGVYSLAKGLNTGIVAINRLPSTPDTLYLRMLGAGKVQQQAIEEFLALFPQTDPLRQSVLDLLLKYRIYLGEKEKQTTLSEEEKELLMNISHIYNAWKQEAFLTERRIWVENLLKCRFSKLDDELSPIVERLLPLPAEELPRILLQASREELVAKFSH